MIYIPLLYLTAIKNIRFSACMACPGYCLQCESMYSTECFFNIHQNHPTQTYMDLNTLSISQLCNVFKWYLFSICLDIRHLWIHLKLQLRLQQINQCLLCIITEFQFRLSIISKFQFSWQDHSCPQKMCKLEVLNDNTIMPISRGCYSIFGRYQSHCLSPPVLLLKWIPDPVVWLLRY